MASDKEKYLIIYNIVTSVIGIATSIVFINGYFGVPELEIKGFAISKVIGYFFGLLTLMGITLFDSDLRGYIWQKMQSGFGKYLPEYIKIGFPNAAMQGIQSMIGVGIALFVGNLGTVQLAIEQSSTMYLTLVQAVSTAIMRASSVCISQEFGHKRYDNVRMYNRSSNILVILTYALPLILLAAMPLILAKLYISDKLIDDNSGLIRGNYVIAGVATLFSAIEATMQINLSSTHDSTIPSAISIATGFVTLFFAYIISSVGDQGLIGVNSGMLIGAFVSMVLMVMRWYMSTNDDDFSLRQPIRTSASSDQAQNKTVTYASTAPRDTGLTSSSAVFQASTPVDVKRDDSAYSMPLHQSINQYSRGYGNEN